MGYNRKSVFVSANGGSIQIIDAAGEVLCEVAIPPGRVPVADYLDLVPEGGDILLSEGLTAILPKSGYGRSDFGELATMSGADPDYQPTNASTFERQMRFAISKLAAENKALAARQAERSAAEAAPAPSPEPQVLEDDGTVK